MHGHEMDYIRNCYNVPAEEGRRVKFWGRPGVIVGARNGKLLIRLGNERRSRAYHPIWNMEYLEKV